MDSVMSEGLKRTLGIVAKGRPKKKVIVDVVDDDGATSITSVEEPDFIDVSEEDSTDDDRDTMLPAVIAHTAVVEFKPKKVKTSIPLTDNSDLRDDYITSRNITHSLIDYAGNALQGALMVALESQHPKAFETFDKLANTMRGLSKDLIDMQKVYQGIVDANNGKIAQHITQNNITIEAGGDGANSTTNTSMSEVVKLIKKMSEKQPNKPPMNRILEDAEFIEMKE